MRKLLFLLLAILMSAQSGICVDKVKLTGGIYSRVTSKYLPGADVAVLDRDSAVLAECKAMKLEWYRDGQQIRRDSIGKYELEIDKVPEDYILRVSKEGYESRYLDFTLKDMKNREFEKKLPNIYLSPERKSVDLDEVVVQATKVKFYHKGDTIVYNADAFMLPEGSMLDALIAQMPGVEIKDGGRIYVNGKYVESLLLNGKDFFKGKNEVMLENIGVYTVKDVAVYEKRGELAELLDADIRDDKKLVMDVRLKKEYMTGTLLNIEASYGTEDRYTGRLFAMRYTDNSRLSLYGNCNNVNNLDRPSDGKGYNIYSGSTPGVTDIYNGGVDYFFDNPLHTWEVSGNADVSYRKNRTDHDLIRFNYLPSGDTYDYQYSRSLTRRFSVSTNHSFKIRKDMWKLTVNPEFSYNNERLDQNSIAASFTQELKEANDEILRNLYTGNYRELQKSIINRNRIESRNRQHGMNAKIWCENTYRIKGSPDGFSFWFETSYNRDTSDGTTLQAVDFGERPENSRLIRRDSQDHPQYKYMVRGSGRYFLNMSTGTFSVGGYFQHDQQRKNSDLFMMEARAEGEEAEFLPGQIPELDQANSYTSMLYENSVVVTPRYNFKGKGSKGTFNLYANCDLVYDHRHLYYHRGTVNADPSRSLFFLRAGTLELRYNTLDNKLNVSMMYKYGTRLASLVDMVDIVNDTDPLNIQLGNPDLRNEGTHTIDCNLRYSMPQNAYLYFYGRYNTYSNQIVRGYRYDTPTGIRTFRSYNVSGAYSSYLTVSYIRDLWLKGLSGRIGCNFDFSQYADMVGENAEPVNQKVRKDDYGYWVALRYAKGIFNASIGTRMQWVTSRYERLQSVSSTFNTSSWVELGIKLPGNIRITTDLNYMTRSGYLDDNLNSHDWLWNAEVSYKLKNAWTFSIRGYDILHQMKQVQYAVNAQGRTQEMYNILPRFVMFSVQYTFDFKPKKHK